MFHPALRSVLACFLVALLLALLAPAALAQEAATSPPAPQQQLTRADEHGTLAQRGQSLLGLGAFVLIAFGIGQLRRPRLRVSWRTVFWGLALQFLFAFLVLYACSILVIATFDVVMEGPMIGIWYWCLFGVGLAALHLHRTMPDLLADPR